MLLLDSPVLFLLTVLIIPSALDTLGISGQWWDDITPEKCTGDPNLVNDPSTNETASPNDKNTTAECWMRNPVHQPVKQCWLPHAVGFTSLLYIYTINDEICSCLWGTWSYERWLCYQSGPKVAPLLKLLPTSSLWKCEFAEAQWSVVKEKEWRTYVWVRGRGNSIFYNHCQLTHRHEDFLNQSLCNVQHFLLLLNFYQD